MIVIAIVVFACLGLEALVSRRNEAVQRQRGGLEPDGDVYAAMRVAYPLSFVVMLAEGLLRGGPAPEVFVAGIVVFGAAKALKYWVITTLGDFWTFRVIVVPFATLVTAGPYRLMRHPNYLAVIGELAGVALMAGAIVTGPVSVAVFLVLLWKRIKIEERALANRGTIRPG